MCLAPKYGLNPLDPNMASPCRTCAQCRQNRVNDWVGRCVAEQATSDQTLSVTLTYAGDHARCVVLCYQDVQNFLKRLRKAGYDVRYIVAGEYGEKNGRTHWHIVLFFRGKTLEIVPAGQKRDNEWQVVLPRFPRDPEAQIDWTPWTDVQQGRGFVYVQEPDYHGIEYCLWYVLKNEGDRSSVTNFGSSKYPPLGYEFLMNLADDHVERRMVVQDPAYAFMDIKGKDGKPRQFWLSGRMRELFLDRYRTMWRLVHKEPEPLSEWVGERYAQKIEDARPLSAADIENIVRSRQRAAQEAAKNASKRRDAKKVDYDLPEFLPDMVFWHIFTHKGKQARIDMYQDGAEINLNDGGAPWLIKRTADQQILARQLLASGLRKTALPRLSAWLLAAWPWIDTSDKACIARRWLNPPS